MMFRTLHLHAHIRAIYALLAFFAVSLSVDAGETTYSVVFSNSISFDKTKEKVVEVPMVAALYRDDKDVNIRHTKDNSRWQISLKYDDPRWKDIPDGTVYWYIKSSDGKIIGPSTNGENMDDGKDSSATTASVRDRMLYKSVDKLKTDGTETTFTYFTCTKGKSSAVSCTFAYAAAAYESSSNKGSQLTYGNPSVQYWRNKSGIKYSLTYNATSSSSLLLPYYDGTFCYVKKPAGWGSIYAYAYISDSEKQTADWHGDKLTTTAEYDGQTYYLWRQSSDKKGTPTKIIFNDGGNNQNPEKNKEGWAFTSGNIYPEYFTMIIKSVRNLTLSLWLSKGKALNL